MKMDGKAMMSVLVPRVGSGAPTAGLRIREHLRCRCFVVLSDVGCGSAARCNR